MTIGNSSSEKTPVCPQCRGNLLPGSDDVCAACQSERDYMRNFRDEGHDPDLDANGICRVCGKYEPE